MDNTLILASASPRRRDLLELMDLEFKVYHADIDESVLIDEDAEHYVKRLAAAKARAVYEAASHDDPDVCALGADTTVVCQQQILGKPEDYQDAERMLLSLSGRWHQVYTAVSLCDGDRQETIDVCSQVKFRELLVKDIQWYWNTGEPADKAGAYGIQGHGGLFVERIDGSYSSIVGLPLCETNALLNRFGINMGNRV